MNTDPDVPIRLRIPAAPDISKSDDATASKDAEMTSGTQHSPAEMPAKAGENLDHISQATGQPIGALPASFTQALQRACAEIRQKLEELDRVARRAEQVHK
ncbi:hypothetical protein N658DRAFT_500000 [Parathielavia hyrcaniae]|uniref:Uncharacterized protein n=1 Tax=Parathielavia hyrcaniae TaxID=113614 RepID=A0AAN6PTS1_9PEZI|nr:hypothetical protein N658DRAFT_500000 [Parathielavia hyrcaniae]